MKRLKIAMLSAAVLAIGGAFATKSSPNVALGYVQSAPGQCIATNITVPCHASATQNCLIGSTNYFRNATCGFLALD